MRYFVISIVIFWMHFATFSQNADSGYDKNYLYSELAFNFGHRYPAPRSFITIFQREVITVSNFSTDFLVGSGLLNFNKCGIPFCPGIRTGVQFVYHIGEKHRLFAGVINDFSSGIFGKVKAGYSYRFAGIVFLSVSYENYFWVYASSHYDYYEDEDGNWIEDYYTTYNNWVWDNDLFTIHFGIGLNF